MQQGAMQPPAPSDAHCSVCGLGIGEGRAVNMPGNRRVCEACVEQARQVLAARHARVQRAAHENRKQSELEEAERDNRLVLELQEDEWLKAAANSCPNCARFLALGDAACPHCGFGSGLGPGNVTRQGGGRGWFASARRGRRRVGAIGALPVRASGPVADVLEEIHPSLCGLMPFFVLSPALLGLALAWRVPWMMSTVVICTVVVGVALLAGSTILLFRSGIRQVMPLAGLAVLAGAAGIVAGRDARAGVAAGAAVILVAALVGAWVVAKRKSLDRVLTSTWGVMALVGAGVLVYAIAKAA